jgi:hypothetical protein
MIGSAGPVVTIHIPVKSIKFPDSSDKSSTGQSAASSLNNAIDSKTTYERDGSHIALDPPVKA